MHIILVFVAKILGFKVFFVYNIYKCFNYYTPTSLFYYSFELLTLLLSMNSLIDGVLSRKYSQYDLPSLNSRIMPRTCKMLTW